MFGYKQNNQVDSNRQISEKELQELLKYVDYNNRFENENSQNLGIPLREKKNKIVDSGLQESSETSPLTSHRKKGFFNVKEQVEADTCVARMNSYEANKIIDSKLSIKNGAQFLKVEKIFLKTPEYSLNELQETCIKQCCSSSEPCDTSLLSLKLGEVFHILSSIFKSLLK